MEVDFEAAVGKGSVGGGHIDHFDFAAAQGEGEAEATAVFPGGDAHFTAFFEHGFDADLGEGLDGGDVVRTGQGGP